MLDQDSVWSNGNDVGCVTVCMSCDLHQRCKDLSIVYADLSHKIRMLAILKYWSHWVYGKTVILPELKMAEEGQHVELFE